MTSWLNKSAYGTYFLSFDCTVSPGTKTQDLIKGRGQAKYEIEWWRDQRSQPTDCYQDLSPKSSSRLLRTWKTLNNHKIFPSVKIREFDIFPWKKIVFLFLSFLFLVKNANFVIMFFRQIFFHMYVQQKKLNLSRDRLPEQNNRVGFT